MFSKYKYLIVNLVFTTLVFESAFCRLLPTCTFFYDMVGNPGDRFSRVSTPIIKKVDIQRKGCRSRHVDI